MIFLSINTQILFFQGAGFNMIINISMSAKINDLSA